VLLRLEILIAMVPLHHKEKSWGITLLEQSFCVVYFHFNIPLPPQKRRETSSLPTVPPEKRQGKVVFSNQRRGTWWAWAELSKDWLPSDLQPPSLHTFYISVWLHATRNLAYTTGLFKKGRIAPKRSHDPLTIRFIQNTKRFAIDNTIQRDKNLFY